jgi:hypothetical protein
MLRRGLLGAAASLALAGLAVASAAARTTSGLRGVVTRGPVSPICVAEQPCYVPVKGVTLVFSRRGREVARVRTRKGGVYRVALRAGTYTVKVLSGRLPEPAKATVERGSFRRVDFSLDTGIR